MDNKKGTKKSYIIRTIKLRRFLFTVLRQMDFLLGFFHLAILLSFLKGSFGYRSPQSIILASEMCLDYVLPGFKLSSVYPGAPPNWNEIQLKRVCRNWRSLVPCLNSIERSPVSRRLLMTAVAASKPLEYLCGDGLQSYLNTYKCMNEEKTKNGIQRCAGKGIKSINQFPASPEVKFGVCRHLNESMDCVAKYAATCGQEAAIFAKAFLEKNFETTRTKLECSGYSQISSWSYSVMTTTTEKNFCSEQYTKDKLKKCLKLLHPTLKLTQIINNTKAMWTANQMTSICKNLQRFMRCADRIFENCEIPRMKTVSKVVESVFSYVCRVGLETYVRVQSCLEREKSTKNTIQQCVKHVLDINPKDFYYNGRYDEKKLCKQMAEMAGYTERAANVCGQQAGELLKELVGNTISPYRTDVKCSSYHTGAIVGIAIGCVIFVSLVFGIHFARKRLLGIHI